MRPLLQVVLASACLLAGCAQPLRTTRDFDADYAELSAPDLAAFSRPDTVLAQTGRDRIGPLAVSSLVAHADAYCSHRPLVTKNPRTGFIICSWPVLQRRLHLAGADCGWLRVIISADSQDGFRSSTLILSYHGTCAASGPGTVTRERYLAACRDLGLAVSGNDGRYFGILQQEGCACYLNCTCDADGGVCSSLDIGLMRRLRGPPPRRPGATRFAASDAEACLQDGD